jgi:cell wall-associated NlpC family hydrolase
MLNISRYIGIPYGMDNDPSKSLDCWNLCRHFAANELGIHFPEFMYDRTNEEAYIEAGRIHIAHQKTLGTTWRQVSQPQLGDIMLIKMRGHPCHCGLYLGKVDGVESFMHTLRGRNSSVEPFTYWGQQVESYYRYHPA